MLHLTPDILESLYETLRLTPPFRRWKLPEADEVEFHCVALGSTAYEDQADYHWNGTRHVIRVSPARHHTLPAALVTVAHEMVHMREEILGVRSDVKHGASFHKLADQVCRAHGFDRGQF